MKKITLLSAILVLMIRLSYSQVVSLEVVGKDTFPMAIMYHGVPVSVFTDSQTTTLAQMYQNNLFLTQQLAESNLAQQQLNNIIGQKNQDITALGQKLDSVNLQLRLSMKNQEDLTTSFNAQKDETKAVKKSLRLKLATSIPITVVVGFGVGVGVAYAHWGKH